MDGPRAGGGEPAFIEGRACMTTDLSPVVSGNEAVVFTDLETTPSS